MSRLSAFGSKLGGFQHWQFRFAEHAIALESARSLYQKAARKMDSRLTADGMTNHLESIWRDSKVGEIYEGANEVQLWSIARVALGRDVTG